MHAVIRDLTMVYEKIRQSVHFSLSCTCENGIGPPNTMASPDREQFASGYAFLRPTGRKQRKRLVNRGEGPLVMARSMANRRGCHVVVTLGGYGMVCAERESGTRYLPAAWRFAMCAARVIQFLPRFGAALIGGRCLRAACRVAVDAAERQVTNPGISPATNTFLTLV